LAISGCFGYLLREILHIVEEQKWKFRFFTAYILTIYRQKATLFMSKIEALLGK